MHGCLNANPFYQNWSQGIGYHTNNRLCSIIGWACNTDHLHYPPHYSGHNERGDVSNHQRLDCLLNRLFRGITKKTSKLRITGLCEGNSLVIPRTKANDVENVSIWWRHHEQTRNLNVRLFIEIKPLYMSTFSFTTSHYTEPMLQHAW